MHEREEKMRVAKDMSKSIFVSRLVIVGRNEKEKRENEENRRESLGSKEFVCLVSNFKSLVN